MGAAMVEAGIAVKTLLQGATLERKQEIEDLWDRYAPEVCVVEIVTAAQAAETAQQLVALSSQDRERIGTLGRAAPSALQINRVLMEQPIATSNWLVEKTGLTPATVNRSLADLEQLGIVRELTAQKRNRLFSYHG